MKLSVSTWSFESLPLEGTLAVAKGLGFNAVDIGCFHRTGKCNFEPEEVSACPDKHAAELSKILGKWELTAADLMVIYGRLIGQRAVNNPDPQVRKELTASIRGIVKFCSLVGIPGLTISPGVSHPGIPFEQDLDTAANEIRKYTEIAGEKGITLRLEPHVLSIADTPERVLAILERSPQTKVTLDFSHFLLQYIGMDRSFKLLPFTDHVHVRQAQFGKLQSRTSEGIINYTEIIAKLRELGYKGFLSLEYIARNFYCCNEVDCISETALTKLRLESILANC